MLIVIKMTNVQKEWKTFEITENLHDGVTASYDVSSSLLTVKGPKGEVSKKLRYPQVYIEVKDNAIVVGTKRFSQSEKKIIHTYRAHIKNLIEGVINGYEYKLVVLFAKFPVTVELKGTTFNVKNLLGEKVPRTVQIPTGVKVDIKGADITVTGIDKELVGQTAASLEQSTRVLNMDRRVVQDGIFITEKPKRQIE